MSLNLKKEIDFTQNVAVDTSVKYYKELASAIDHPTTLKQLGTYFIRLTGPVLLFVGLILLTISFFRSINTPAGFGMNSYIVSQNNEEVVPYTSFFQIWAIRTGPFTGTTFKLPDPGLMTLGATITVRNVSDNLNGLTPEMAQAYVNFSFADGGTRNTLTVMTHTNACSEIIRPFSNDGSTNVSSTYLCTLASTGSQQWFKAGLPFL